MDFFKTLKTPTPVFPNDSGAIVTISSTTSLSGGFQALIKHNLLSVPVYDPIERSFLGFFTMLDLVVHVLELMTGLDFPEGDATAFMSLLTEKEQFSSHRVRDVMGKGGEPYVCVGDNEPVDRVARTMVLRHAHRAVVLHQTGELVNVITQSRLIECVNELWGIDPTLSSLANRKIGEIKIGSRDVISIPEHRPALDAFKLIREKGVCGIAVVRGNELVGNISSHDLTRVKSTGSYLKLLYAPVCEYLERVTKEHKMGLIKCTPQETFKVVVDRMVENQVHRCYIVQSHESNILVGIISLSDILAAIVGQPEIALPSDGTEVCDIQAVEASA